MSICGDFEHFRLTLARPKNKVFFEFEFRLPINLCWGFVKTLVVEITLSHYIHIDGLCVIRY